MNAEESLENKKNLNEIIRNDSSDNVVAEQKTESISSMENTLASIKSPQDEIIVNGSAPNISKNDLNHILESPDGIRESTDSEQEVLINEELLSKANSEQSKKIKKIVEALVTLNIQDLNRAAVSKYGLVSDDLRQKVWPKLIGVDVYATSPRPTLDEIENHPYYQQVVLDVNRSLKRFPPSIKEKQRLAMQDQLVLLIMRVLVKHPKLHYYQGYHDICVTFLLVLGEEMAFHVIDKLSISHLETFMKESMEPTTEMLTYIFAVVQKENPKLYKFLETSEVGVMFALSWLITWFGHVLNNYSDVVRLFDLFISSNRWLPVYLATAIVLYRETEIMEQDCDIACVHSLLSNIPDDLPFEDLIVDCHRLFKAYPPKSIEKIVSEQIRKKNEALMKYRHRNKTYTSIITKAIKSVIPTGMFTVSIVIAAAVVMSAVLYQSYKT